MPVVPTTVWQARRRDSSPVDRKGDSLPTLTTSAGRATPIAATLALTALAVLTHGYHLGADDAAIYVPAIKRVADPSLYPFGSAFFMSHAHLSFFSEIVGNSARLTHLPIDLAIFAWHFAGIWLLLLAAWRLAAVCFQSDSARWGSVVLLAALLSVPVAGTALVIMDPYLTARSLSTPATMFTIACYLSNQWKQALAWLLLTALVHPQMSVYAVVFLGCFTLMRRFAASDGLTLALPASLPFLYPFQASRGPARQALFSRTYFFVGNWTWYEWSGIAAPLALLWWFSAITPRGTKPAFRTLAAALVPFGLLSAFAGVLLGIPTWLENYTRLQPMRSFHLAYVIFFVLVGGLLQEYVLFNSRWRWLCLFVPLAAGMWLLQWSSFPASRHVEWPGSHSANMWTSAFLWIRDHTPKDAVFALDPDYMLSPGEDMHGFRAVAERSVLADLVKDSGAVSLFPQLADEWNRETQAESGWADFHQRDFEKLATEYPVTWIVTLNPAPVGMVCPYHNQHVAVCRVQGPGIQSPPIQSPPVTVSHAAYRE